MGLIEMIEINITDVLDRRLHPGNIVAVNTLRQGGHIFDGVWTIVGLEYLDDGEAWRIELRRYKVGGPSRFIDGYRFEGSCFANSELILKLAEGAGSL